MNFDKFFSILMTLAIVALATTLVLPGRQTPAVIRESFGGLSGLTRASMGQR
jgi:hypothetical protein